MTFENTGAPAPTSLAQLSQQTFQSAPSGGTALPPVQPNQLGGGSLPGNAPPVQYPPGFVPNTPPVQQPPVQQPAAAPTYTPSPLAAPPVIPGRAILDSYIQRGDLPANIEITSDAELVERLVALVSDTGEPQAPPAAPAPAVAPPVQQTAPPTGATPPGSDLMQAALAFQQAGMISVANGIYTAVNPLASDIVAKLNEQAVRQQATLAQLSDPKTFIANHGSDVFKQQLDPVLAELKALKQQNDELQARIQAAAPKPWAEFFNTHGALLRNADGTPTPIGSVYDATWKAATSGGIRDEATLHQIASTAVLPHLQGSQRQQPQQTFMQYAGQSQASPGFNAPGSQMSNVTQQSPIGMPLTNKGYPDFAAMMTAIPTS